MKAYQVDAIVKSNNTEFPYKVVVLAETAKNAVDWAKILWKSNKLSRFHLFRVTVHKVECTNLDVINNWTSCAEIAEEE